MDLLKTKIYLDKLNREFSRLSRDPENIVRIDVDIMLSYVRELYDALLDHTAQNPAFRPEPVAPPKPVAKTLRDKTPEPAAPEPPFFESAPTPAQEPPPPVEPTRPAPAPPPPPVYVAPPTPEPPPVPRPAPAPASNYYLSPELEILFEEKQARELSERLSELPIADLRRAIALNDRLLLTRELFASDSQAFEQAIIALNNLSSFEEAKAFLVQNCVVRFSWTEKKRLEIAKNFIKLVRRRYK